MKAKIFFLAVVLGVATPGFGQSFNVDVGPTTPFGVPSDGYAAGAGQPGTWNAVNHGAGNEPLSDLTGGPTGVTLSSSGGDANFSANNAGTTGDDQALMDDLQDVGDAGSPLPPGPSQASPRGPTPCIRMPGHLTMLRTFRRCRWPAPLIHRSSSAAAGRAAILRVQPTRCTLSMLLTERSPSASPPTLGSARSTGSSLWVGPVSRARGTSTEAVMSASSICWLCWRPGDRTPDTRPTSMAQASSESSTW